MSTNPDPFRRTALTEAAFDHLVAVLNDVHTAWESDDKTRQALVLARSQMVPTAGPRPVDFDHPLPENRWTPSSIEVMTDVLTTAAEGGIQGWAQVEVYKHDCLPAERRIEVRVDEYDTNPDSSAPERHRVDLYTINDGIRALALAGFPPSSDAAEWSTMATDLMAALRVSDPDERRSALDDIDYDAGFADAVVQFGLFGQLVYG